MAPSAELIRSRMAWAEQAIIRLGFLSLVICLLVLRLQAQAPSSSDRTSATGQCYYSIDLDNRAQHSVHVRAEITKLMANREVRLPVWNALYQVRDFSQYL